MAPTRSATAPHGRRGRGPSGPARGPMRARRRTGPGRPPSAGAGPGTSPPTSRGRAHPGSAIGSSTRWRVGDRSPRPFQRLLDGVQRAGMQRERHVVQPLGGRLHHPDLFLAAAGALRDERPVLLAGLQAEVLQEALGHREVRHFQRVMMQRGAAAARERRPDARRDARARGGPDVAAVRRVRRLPVRPRGGPGHAAQRGGNRVLAGGQRRASAEAVAASPEPDQFTDRTATMTQGYPVALAKQETT